MTMIMRGRRFMMASLNSALTPPTMRRRVNRRLTATSPFVHIVGWPERQGQPEHRPALHIAGHADVPADEPGVLQRDGQAKPAARAGPRGIGLVEALEDQRKLLRGDARPAVGHLDAALDTVRAGPHPDVATAVLDRVLYQVGQYSLDPARIGDQGERLPLHGDPVLPAPRADQRRRDGPDVGPLPLYRL